jgi:hypothetical protein
MEPIPSACYSLENIPQTSFAVESFLSPFVTFIFQPNETHFFLLSDASSCFSWALHSALNTHELLKYVPQRRE